MNSDSTQPLNSDSTPPVSESPPPSPTGPMAKKVRLRKRDEDPPPTPHPSPSSPPNYRATVTSYPAHTAHGPSPRALRPAPTACPSPGPSPPVPQLTPPAPHHQAVSIPTHTDILIHDQSLFHAMQSASGAVPMEEDMTPVNPPSSDIPLTPPLPSKPPDPVPAPHSTPETMEISTSQLEVPHPPLSATVVLSPSAATPQD
ncbi:hypothetical protein K2173_006565 [Erythroxylum novogranatense]|uniref:Uncharacterized protein n=1 Tax=Erythroxylum novogranatense TaxID=1862640 RepID=A0AAV8T6Z2_9ROSI|nr:hypothetical protein K2173_006565 [Erythroxylum novogranatense]